MYFLGGQKHLQRPSLADQARQTLRPAPSRYQSKGSAAVSEDGVRTGNASLARQSEIKTSAHTVAVDGRDGGSREARHRTHQVLAHVRETECFRTRQGGNFVEVCSGREEVSIPGEDEARGWGGRELL